LELSVGNAKSAHEHLATYSVERGIEGTKRIAFIGDEIEALTLLGSIAEATALTDELDRRGTLLHRPTLAATAARCRGLVLGARGLTNRELAAELYVTVRAVEANLSRIYAKLEVRSRTELASRL